MASGVFASLKSEIKGDVFSAVNAEVKVFCEETLRESINKNLYERFDSGDYVRTGDVLNAVRVMNIRQSGDLITFTVTVDSSHIIPRITDGNWNQHADMDGDSFNDEGLLTVLDEGSSNPKNLHTREGAEFFDKAEKTLDEKLVNELVRAMRARGWNAKSMM